MPTETERCIESLIAVFQKYIGKDGNNTQLSKTEFLSFMNTELAAFTKNQKDPGVLDRMMKKLDLNCDGQLDFQEFLNLIGGLAIACHDSFISSHPTTKSSPPPTPSTPALSPAHLPQHVSHACWRK
uniref:Protein S100 n=1 Tax=Mus spicilegus TaxID=10103 RepID=A0A8C6H8W9_MUSSI